MTTTLGGSNNFIAGGNVYVARQHFGNASDTVTTPSYSWLGAPTTGLYRQASNVVAFTSNGIDQLRIGPQSLGIGSTNSQINVRGDLTMIQGGAIVPSVSSSSADGVHGIIWPANPGGASGSAWIKWYQGGFSSLYTTLEIGTGSDTHDILYFNTSGKVGFGISVPNYKIDVSGDVNVTGAYYVNGVALGGGSGTVTSLTAGTGISLSPSTITTTGTISTVQDISTTATPTFASLTLNTASGAKLSLTGATSNWIAWNANGAGAPTFTSSSAGTKLILNPAVTATSADYALGINTNVLWTGVPTTSQSFAWYAGTTQVSALTGAGALSATGEITAYSSDARLKQNVELIPDALGKVQALRGVTFSWDKDKSQSLGFEPRDGRDIGVIAQEVQAVLPEAVRPAPFDWDNMEGRSRSGEDYLTVQYEKLTALLIEAVKQLKAEVDELRARLDSE